MTIRNMNRQPIATASSYYHHPLYAPQAVPRHYHDPSFASLGYRPLQLPLQHQHSAEQLGLALQPSVGFHHPLHQHQEHHPFRPLPPQQHSLVLAHQTCRQGRQQHQANMAYPQPDEMEEFQKLSDQYQPEVTVCMSYNVVQVRLELAEA